MNLKELYRHEQVKPSEVVSFIIPFSVEGRETEAEKGEVTCVRSQN